MTTTERRSLGKEDFERMNLPEEYWRVKIHEVANEVRPTIERYLQNIDLMVKRGAGLILGGPTGVGKTAIAALVAKEARACGFTAYFATTWELRECIRARVSFDDEASVLDRCRDVDVFILDGLKPEDASEKLFGVRDIEDLLTIRGARKKLSIVTTRMSRHEMTSMEPGSAKMSGLVEAIQGCMVYVPVTGKNQRTEKQEDLVQTVLGTASR